MSMTIIGGGGGLNGEGWRLGRRTGEGGGRGLALGILGSGSIRATTLTSRGLLSRSGPDHGLRTWSGVLGSSPVGRTVGSLWKSPSMWGSSVRSVLRDSSRKLNWKLTRNKTDNLNFGEFLYSPAFVLLNWYLVFRLAKEKSISNCLIIEIDNWLICG